MLVHSMFPIFYTVLKNQDLLVKEKGDISLAIYVGANRSCNRDLHQC